MKLFGLVLYILISCVSCAEKSSPNFAKEKHDQATAVSSNKDNESTQCSFENLSLNDLQWTNSLSIINKLNATNVTRPSEDLLNNNWMELEVDHNQKVYSVISIDDKDTYIQSFNNLKIDFENALVSYNVTKSNSIVKSNYEISSIIEYKEKNSFCKQPKIILIQFKNENKILLYMSAFRNEEIAFPDHISLISKYKENIFVSPSQHLKHGINADLKLIQQLVPESSEHSEIRNSYRKFDGTFTSQCDNLQLKNFNYELKECLSNGLNKKSKVFRVAMHERASRKMGKVTFYNELINNNFHTRDNFSAIINLELYSNSFYGSVTDFKVIRMGHQKPNFLIDEETNPDSKLKIDGNWDSEKQFMFLKYNNKKNLIELDYFELLEYDMENSTRTIKVKYGTN